MVRAQIKELYMTTTTFTKRPANERGHAEMGWLDSWHSFSFADYYDPAHQHFRTLRVINEDVVAAGRGFPMHPHREMEILTYVISGQLTHRDSMGNSRTVHAGQVQYMSAGQGVAHREMNDSTTEPVHLLQIWIFPNLHGGKPLYGEWTPPVDRTGPLTLVAGADVEKGVLTLRQNAKLFLGELKAGQTATHATEEYRGLWLQVISGELNVGGEYLAPGDGLAVEDVTTCDIAARSDSKFLLFDLP
jgi:redox-sensitive bicupin YhaK (pirin superfamily)